MNKQKHGRNRYAYLSMIATVSVPLAPAFFFGWRIYAALTSLGVPVWLATTISTAGAVGLELVGILAGHTMMVSWRLQDYPRTVLSGCIMGIYVTIGVIELWGGIGAVMFLIAPLVYILAALQEGLDTAVEHSETLTAETQAFNLEQQRADAEHKRMMEAEAQRLRIDAQIKIKLAHDQAQSEIETARAKAQAAIANADARKAKAQAELEIAQVAQSQHEFAQEQMESQHEFAQEQFLCDDCGRPFGTVQALNAHGRFCTVRVPANGVENHV